MLVVVHPLCLFLLQCVGWWLFISSVPTTILITNHFFAFVIFFFVVDCSCLRLGSFRLLRTDFVNGDNTNFILQYLSCLSTSSSNDKLAFDVGLQETAEGHILESIKCSQKYFESSMKTPNLNYWLVWHRLFLFTEIIMIFMQLNFEQMGFEMLLTEWCV